jgi:hypothetical protein
MAQALSVPDGQSTRRERSVQMIPKKLLIVLAMLTTASWIFSSEANQLPKTLAYKLDVRIDYDAEKLNGKCEITLSNGTSQPMAQIPILLYRLLTVKSVENENNKPLPFTQKVISISGWEKIQVNFLEISLSKGLPPGKQIKLNIEYEGYLLGYSEAGWRYVKDHIDKNFTIIRTDGFGYPVVAFPTEREMMAIAKERYDYLIHITIPDDMFAVTAGELIDQIKTDKQITFIYKSKKPSFRLDIAISDYKLLEKNNNKTYYFPSDSTGARTLMDALDVSWQLYTNWFGPLNNDQGYSIIEVPEGYGSQMDVAAFLISADNFNKPGDMHTIYHEVAHLWNVIHLDPQPCRFESEGFAQFLQFLASEKLDHKENAVSDAAQGYLDRIKKDFIEKTEYQNIPIKDYGIHDMTKYSYTLGMVVFALFYDLVGQESFNKIIGSFYSEYYANGATLEEFINHCKKSALLDLESFFNDWIYTTKAIHLVVNGKTFKEFIQYYKEN